VDRYAREEFTTIIHGKHRHEETLATCSRAERDPGSHYLVVRDMEEAMFVARVIETGEGLSEFQTRFAEKASVGFDPAVHLDRIGLANQTTMLMSESLAIGERLRAAFVLRHGEEEARARFRNFDTICSATQERQDAVAEMMKDPPDLMIVVGGYNSSNTNHLAELSTDHGTPAFHIEDFSALQSGNSIRYKPVRQEEEIIEPGWLPQGSVRIGVTAGASTPNNRIGEVLATILNLRRVALPVEAN
jgi:4-hydroxy-3-methylbut-2-enyl diphosphate reductase